MKKLKRKPILPLLIGAVALCALLIGISGCDVADSSGGQYPHYTKEELFRESALIMQGKVAKKGKSAKTHPFHKVENRTVTDYTVEIQEVYKGENAEETVVLKVGNYLGENFTLEVGDTYIFTLEAPLGKEQEERKRFWGYYTSAMRSFLEQEDGSYQNSWGDCIDPATIRQEIAAATEQK